MTVMSEQTCSSHTRTSYFLVRLIWSSMQIPPSDGKHYVFFIHNHVSEAFKGLQWNQDCPICKHSKTTLLWVKPCPQEVLAEPQVSCVPVQCPSKAASNYNVHKQYYSQLNLIRVSIIHRIQKRLDSHFIKAGKTMGIFFFFKLYQE